uniref:SWIM-type domain-containing protein n=1 Tax=Strongyloides papillosus TaxID=174720 RepID=A0A0N5C0V5_STREA
MKLSSRIALLTIFVAIIMACLVTYGNAENVTIINTTGRSKIIKNDLLTNFFCTCYMLIIKTSRGSCIHLIFLIFKCSQFIIYLV